MIKPLVFAIALFLVIFSAILVPSVSGAVSALILVTWLVVRVMSS